MALPQSNYTQYPNEILDNLHLLSGSELKVISAICRHTLGFHQAKKRMSISFLMKATGLSNRVVILACNNLADRDWIEKFANKKGSEYSIKLECPDVKKDRSLKNEGMTKSHRQNDQAMTKSHTPYDEKSQVAMTKSHTNKETELKKLSFSDPEQPDRQKEKNSANALEKEPTPKQKGSTQSTRGEENQRTGLSPQDRSNSTQIEGVAKSSASKTPSPKPPSPSRDASRSRDESTKEQYPWRDGRKIDPEFCLFVGEQLPKGRNDGSMSSQTKGRKYIVNSEESESGLDKVWGDWDDYQAKLSRESASEAPSTQWVDRSKWIPKPNEPALFLPANYRFTVKAAIERNGRKYLSEYTREEAAQREAEGKADDGWTWFEICDCAPIAG